MNKKYLLPLKCAALSFVAGGLMVSTASAQSLLLNYNFDEASGPAVDHGSGTANPGSLEGGAVRSSNAPGNIGSSISFLNDDSYAHVLGDNAPKLNNVEQFTLTTWVNVSEYTAGNNRLVAQQDGGNFGGFSWNMNADVNSGEVGPDNFKLALFVGNNEGFAGDQFGSALSDEDVGAHDQWVFLAASYDGTTGNVDFYRGDESATVASLGTQQTTGAMTVDAGAARFGVGFTDGAPTSDTSVTGLQDDIRVYSGLLNSGDLDTVRMENIPEPSTYAAIFGGIALLGAFVHRRRMSAKK